MIPKKYSGKELRNRYCRPVCKIKNGHGDAVSPETICRIVDVVPGHGFIIETEKCTHCGQSAYIARVAREKLELIKNPVLDDLINDGCNCCNGDEALFYTDNENCAFIDSNGEIMVVVKGNVMRFKVPYCPNCGKEFAKK